MFQVEWLCAKLSSINMSEEPGGGGGGGGGGLTGNLTVVPVVSVFMPGGGGSERTLFWVTDFTECQGYVKYKILFL